VTPIKKPSIAIYKTTAVTPMIETAAVTQQVAIETAAGKQQTATVTCNK